MEVKELEVKVNNTALMAKGIEVSTDAQQRYAEEFLKRLKKGIKAVENFYNSMRVKALEMKRDVDSQIKKYKKPLEEAEGEIKTKLSAYVTEQAKKRREEEQRIQKEAREKEEVRRAELAKKGEPEITGPVIIPQVKIQAPPKTQGISYVETWHYDVLDESLIPNDYRIIDYKKIAADVKVLKDRTNIPGIKVYSKQEARSRA